MRVVNERWNELENELGLGLPLNTLSEVDIAEKWRLRALNAENLLNNPSLTIPKVVADELEEEIEEAYSNDYIRSYSDVGAYMEVITDGLDEDSELYKFMFPANDALLGCSHRNIIYLYLVDNDLVKVVADE